MKKVMEEDEEEDNEEEAGMLGEAEGEQRRLFKKVSPVSRQRLSKLSPQRMDSDEKLSRWANKGGLNGLMKRNQSFLLPREKSFGT